MSSSTKMSSTGFEGGSALSYEERSAARAAGQAARFTEEQKHRLRDIFRPSLLKLVRAEPPA
ncbi:hypothetical protein [Saccharopolyspora hattusasensis]|uniref:hypothetical protein n=1 Tax=Saccharopolyspora hattusasensis TaxID=1128679 RepID=UPI003D967532